MCVLFSLKFGQFDWLQIGTSQFWNYSCARNSRCTEMPQVNNKTCLEKEAETILIKS